MHEPVQVPGRVIIASTAEGPIVGTCSDMFCSRSAHAKLTSCDYGRKGGLADKRINATNMMSYYYRAEWFYARTPNAGYEDIA